MSLYQLIPFIGLPLIIIVWLWKRRQERKAPEEEMWKAINEPKVEELIPVFDENGKPIAVAKLLDRIPYFIKDEPCTCDTCKQNGENKNEQKNQKTT